MSDSSETLTVRLLPYLAHGLKRPLSAVLLSADILRRGGLADDDVQALAASIVISAREAVDLAEDLVALLRLETAQWALSPATLDVAPVVLAAMADLGPDASFENPSGGPTEAVADRIGLEHLVGCLVSQVVSARPPGGRIHVGFGGDRQRLDLSIDVPSVPTAGLESIFEPFAGSFGTPGLALPLARALAESQGGRLVAIGNAEQGTTFVLSLPRPGVSRAGGWR